jgi:DNA-binding LacI/PurR family transcriptional regulator
MVTISFPDRDTEKQALAYLLSRFSGLVLRSGEHLVPAAALEELADQNIPFIVVGKATVGQQIEVKQGPDDRRAAR